MNDQARSPILSVIVPCFNVERYIEDCLHSVLSQSTHELEVVIVDDASTDSTWEKVLGFLDHPQVRLFKMDENRGIGAARNFGLDCSIGDYFIFLDADDWLFEGALSLLIEKIRQPKPDLIYFNFARFFAHGSTAISAPYDRLFQQLEHMPDSNQKRLLLLDFPTMSWFKAYRRNFVADTGIRFGDRIYEDVFWSHALTSLSTSTEVVPQILYCYRQHRSSLMKSAGHNHLELIDEYTKLFKFGLSLNNQLFQKTFILKAVEHYELVLYDRVGNLGIGELIQFLKHASLSLQFIEDRERDKIVSTARTLTGRFRRNAMLRGQPANYFVMASLYRLAYIAVRPFQLLRIYFSNRRIKVLLPHDSA